MKKLLICALAAVTFIGLTGCSNEKKLSAEEAKTTIKAAKENTEKKLEKAASFKIKDSVKLTTNATDLKALAGTSALVVIEKAKATASAETTVSAAYNKTDKKAKVSASASGKVDANITSSSLKNLLGWDSPKKFTYDAKANGEAYYVDGESQANVYAKYDATLNDQIVKDFKLETGTFNGKYNFKTLMFMGLIDKINFDDDDDTTTTETTSETTTDSEFIKDWTIFKKKGNTIIADCSNLEAFDLGEDFKKVQTELKEKGIEFKVSKFEIELDKENAIKAVDAALSVDGKVDLSKVEIDKDDIKEIGEKISSFSPEAGTIIAKLPIDKLSGTLNFDFDFNAGFEIGYTEETITVPTDLAEATETDLDEIIMEVIFGVKKKPTTPETGE